LLSLVIRVPLSPLSASSFVGRRGGRATGSRFDSIKATPIAYFSIFGEWSRIFRSFYGCAPSGDPRREKKTMLTLSTLRRLRAGRQVLSRGASYNLRVYIITSIPLPPDLPILRSWMCWAPGTPPCYYQHSGPHPLRRLQALCVLLQAGHAGCLQPAKIKGFCATTAGSEQRANVSQKVVCNQLPQCFTGCHTAPYRT
jgi:hypothetical protein